VYQAHFCVDIVRIMAVNEANSLTVAAACVKAQRNTSNGAHSRRLKGDHLVFQPQHHCLQFDLTRAPPMPGGAGAMAVASLTYVDELNLSQSFLGPQPANQGPDKNHADWKSCRKS
jgi:hypothetical protein